MSFIKIINVLKNAVLDIPHFLGLKLAINVKIMENMNIKEIVWQNVQNIQ